LTETGEPIYGARDEADLDELKKTGLPFWLAGMFGSHEKLREAMDLGAAGVQVGTPFAFCRESGITDEIKKRTLKNVIDGTVAIFTDPCASASGYPFKVLSLSGTLSEKRVYENRQRVCDLGYLRSAYTTADGSIGFRCPGEPEGDYVRKGGNLEDTAGRKCLCNALLATVGVEQVRKDGYVEPAIVTAGDHVNQLKEFLKEGKTEYSAKTVVDQILGRVS
jgi:nitronate monooxygenase